MNTFILTMFCKKEDGSESIHNFEVQAENVVEALEDSPTWENCYKIECTLLPSPLNTFRFTYQGSDHTETVDVEATDIRDALDKLDKLPPSHRQSALISCELRK
jgi:hypothetical protein